MDKTKIQFSANFKRDYVAASAVAIFIIIVVAEVALAFSLPLYLRRENTMALSVRRLRLIETFDATRNLGRSLRLRDETAEAERRVLLWNLDLLSDYLRNHVKQLSGNEIAGLQKQLNEMSAALTKLKSGRPFSQEYKLDGSACLESILQRSGVLNVK